LVSCCLYYATIQEQGHLYITLHIKF